MSHVAIVIKWVSQWCRLFRIVRYMTCPNKIGHVQSSNSDTWAMPGIRASRLCSVEDHGLCCLIISWISSIQKKNTVKRYWTRFFCFLARGTWAFALISRSRTPHHFAAKALWLRYSSFCVETLAGQQLLILLQPGVFVSWEQVVFVPWKQLRRFFEIFLLENSQWIPKLIPNGKCVSFMFVNHHRFNRDVLSYSSDTAVSPYPQWDFLHDLFTSFFTFVLFSDNFQYHSGFQKKNGFWDSYWSHATAQVLWRAQVS